VSELAESFRNAINCAKDGVEAGTIPSMAVIPLSAYLSLAKLVLATGGFQEALALAVECCAVYPHASAAYLMAGVCCLRLDRSTDAEDALQVD
jgi:Flp pilus assembly protein TadD